MKHIHLLSVISVFCSIVVMGGNVNAQSTDVSSSQALNVKIHSESIAVNEENKKYEYTGTQLIEIINPYIKETFNAYSIQNENELISKIGLENFKSLEKRIQIATVEKRDSLSRAAVSVSHERILRQVGATVESHWWGRRIKTYSRDVAINVRKLAHGFSGDAGSLGLTTSLASMGIGFIPGLGTAAAIAGTLLGVMSWADSSTWSDVSAKVAAKIDEGQYNLTIDINALIMNVQVY